jgi:Pin2-interacting protein X1
MLTQQGWTPGENLGATDAAHAAHYTAASNSHIRVLLKDDTLGIGAKRGSERAENFGLAGLASILGRLNGNDEDVKKEEERLEKVEQRAYVYRKFGMMNFVSGGFLVGGEIKKKAEIKLEEKSEEEGEKKEKKRKRVKTEEDEATQEITEEEPKLKRKKKSKNLREEPGKEIKSKKEKKSKKSSKSASPATESSATISTATPSDRVSSKAQRKAEKPARKQEKALKKALKKASKEASTKAASSDSDDDEDEEGASTIPTTGTSTPINTAAGLTFGAGGRHAVRQRYIRQKRMAAMDPQALKEVCYLLRCESDDN